MVSYECTMRLDRAENNLLHIAYHFYAYSPNPPLLIQQSHGTIAAALS
jgi:hypothetical protein